MRRRLSSLATLVVAVIVGCSTPPSVPPQASSTSAPITTAPTAATTPPAATAERVTGWREDLERLVPGMAAIHPDLTHGTTMAALDGAVAALVGSIESASDDELMVGLLRIVAMVSAAGCDAHTGAFIWGTGRYPVDSLPLRLWLFPTELVDALVVVDALPPYEDLIGSTIGTIEDDQELQVRRQLASVIPRDNDWTFRLLAPRYVLIPQVLRGLGIADDGPVSLGLTTPGGSSRTVDVQPIPMAEYNAWAGPYGLHLPEDPDVLYLSDLDDALWWRLLPDAVTLYVQYNRVESLATAIVADLRSAAESPDIERVVLDVRHNFGGELSALDPIVSLFSSPALDRPNGLFLIEGRNTFSAGSLLVARLDRTAAVIVGEPMGGCPTLYGDAQELLLPFSGIDVSVASELSVGVRADDDRKTIEPDVIATLTQENWLDGRDPSLEAIVLAAP